jgi:hypothetical protein
VRHQWWPEDNHLKRLGCLPQLTSANSLKRFSKPTQTPDRADVSQFARRASLCQPAGHLSISCAPEGVCCASVKMLPDNADHLPIGKHRDDENGEITEVNR